VTPEEAVKVASLVADLWPATTLEATRKAFYANSLTVIPTSDLAIKAVNKLFVTERFQPTPGQIIDHALALDDLSALEWQRITQTAIELQGRQPASTQVDHRAVLVVRRLCGGIAQLPVSNWQQMDRLRSKFITEYTAIQRDDYNEETRLELGT
jgi:hypothetical protein